MLLDQIGFQHERLNLVINDDKLKIRDVTNELASFGVVIATRVEIRPNAIAQVLGLADIDYLADPILMNIDSGVRRQRLELLGQCHRFNFNARRAKDANLATKQNFDSYLSSLALRQVICSSLKTLSDQEIVLVRSDILEFPEH